MTVADHNIRRATARHAARTGQHGTRLRDVPLPVALLLLSLLVPREFEFNIGIAMTCQRMVLLVAMPIALVRLANSLRLFDLLFVSAFAYFWFAITVNHPFDTALQSGGSLFLEAVGGYAIARGWIRTEDTFRATARLLFLLVSVMCLAAAIESVLHVHWIKDFARQLVGGHSAMINNTRLGLMRAAATFDHPIHFGTFCASVFALIWFLEPGGGSRWLRLVVATAATFFSLSSAAWVGIVLVLIGAIWEHQTRGLPNRVSITAVALAIAYVFLAVAANRTPAQILSTTFVFDSENASYRLHIWEYGVENVRNHPWVGLPLGTWSRPDWMVSASVDHYWLLTALSGGLPTVILYCLSIATLVHAINRRGVEPTLGQKQCRYAWVALVAVMCFVGTTVAYWREIEVYFTFCLGMGAWLADSRRPVRRQQSNADRTPAAHIGHPTLHSRRAR